MKQLIIAAIVSLGLVAQSSSVSIDQQTGNGQAKVAVGSSPVDGSQQLGPREMSATVGGENLSGCWSYKDEFGDTHGICCVDLWVITVCAGVNWSAIERILPF
jgi:hypothetical protein